MIQMQGSIDTIALVRSYRQIPPFDELSELGGFIRKFGSNGEPCFISNGMKDVHEPRISIYKTWDKTSRLRVDLSVPRLLFGANVKLPSGEEIEQALELVSNNVEQRTGLKFDAFSADACRNDYAANLIFEGQQIKLVMKRYRNFNVPRLLRVAYGDETVYFRNQSRTIRIYDKFAEMCRKIQNSALQAESKGIIRAEYSLRDLPSVKGFARRLHFDNISAREMTSEKCIAAATGELKKLLELDSINFISDKNIAVAFEKTGNIKTAMNLVGFLEAMEWFGSNFYLDKNYDISRTTYDRLLKECQNTGLI